MELARAHRRRLAQALSMPHSVRRSIERLTKPQRRMNQPAPKGREQPEHEIELGFA